ncbi:MAG: transposase [Bacillota bacterium]
MSRQPRKLSSTGIYHLMVRGVNKEPIFRENSDRLHFLDTLKRISDDSDTSVLGYCLMDNHVHLLIKEGIKGVSNLMHRLNASYAHYFNRKYERVGHVFQNRFKSENVEDEAYLLAALRYIHNNPIRAKLVDKRERYKWSSCKAYYGQKDYPPGLTDTKPVLALFSGNEEEAIIEFREFSEGVTEDICMDYRDEIKLSDANALKIIKGFLGGTPLHELGKMPKAERDLILKQLKAIDGLSIRQIARLTEVGFNIVSRA